VRAWSNFGSKQYGDGIVARARDGNDEHRKDWRCGVSDFPLQGRFSLESFQHLLIAVQEEIPAYRLSGVFDT
jgi:hypothetical protein